VEGYYHFLSDNNMKCFKDKKISVGEFDMKISTKSLLKSLPPLPVLNNKRIKMIFYLYEVNDSTNSNDNFYGARKLKNII